MIDASLMAALLDSLKDPVVFVDTKHVIRYLNKAAVAHKCWRRYVRCSRPVRNRACGRAESHGGHGRETETDETAHSGCVRYTWHPVDAPRTSLPLGGLARLNRIVH